MSVETMPLPENQLADEVSSEEEETSELERAKRELTTAKQEEIKSLFQNLFEQYENKEKTELIFKDFCEQYEGLKKKHAIEDMANLSYSQSEIKAEDIVETIKKLENITWEYETKGNNNGWPVNNEEIIEALFVNFCKKIVEEDIIKGSSQKELAIWPWFENSIERIMELETRESITEILGIDKEYAYGNMHGWVGMEKTFMEELIKYTGEHSEEESLNLSKKVREKFFSCSETPATMLTTEELFNMTAKITRIPELQGYIGSPMIGQMVYRANFSDESTVENIAEIIHKTSVYEKMDMLELLEILFAQSVAEGWANNSQEYFKQTLTKVESKNKSFFIQQYIENIKKRLEIEEETPTLGVVKFWGDKKDSRLYEQIKESEKQNIEKTEGVFRPDKRLYGGEKMIRIGKDLVAIIDHTGKPMRLAKASEQSFQTEPLPTKPVDLVLLEDVIEIYEKDEKLHEENPQKSPHPTSQINFANLLKFVSDNNILPNKDISTIEELEKEWKNLCGELNTPWTVILQDLRFANLLPAEEKEKIINSLKSRFEEIEKEQEGRMVNLNFTDYTELSKQYNYKIANEEDPTDIFLMMQHLHKSEIKNKIEEKFKIRMIDIPFNYQIHFLKFLIDKDEQKINEVSDFLDQSTNQEDRTNRIKAFISTENESGIAEKIFNIAEKAKPEFSEKVFEKYADITDQIENSKELIASMLKQQNVDDEEIRKINSNLIAKANQMMLSVAEKIEKSTETETLNQEELLKIIDSYKADVLLTTSIYKTLHKEGSDIRPEDLEGVTFEIKNGKEIFQDKETFNEMCRIYINNYADKPKLAKSLAEGLEKQLESQGNKTRIYIYKKDGHVMAFNRFDDKFDEQEDAKYFGSFNVQSELQDSSLGSALFQKSLEEETKERKPIKAVCFSFSSATVMYIEKGGFIANQFERLSEDPSSPVIHIEKNENFSPKYSGKTQDEIISEYQENLDKNTEEDSASIVRIPISDKEKIDSTMEDFLNNKKYLLTRYFCDKERKNVYAVFEKGA